MKAFIRYLVFSWRGISASAAIVIVLSVSILPCRGQDLFHITFDEPPEQSPGTARIVEEYSEFPLWFRPMGEIGPGNGFVRVGSNPAAFRPDNGTAYIQTGLGQSLAFSLVDYCCLNATSFDLISVDLAEYSTTVPDPRTVRFTGYRPDGSSVTAFFTTDGIIDGTGPLNDFQTFYFGEEFSGLTRVKIPTYGWSMDNLVVAIPEPSISLLLGAGALTFWCLHRRRQKR